MVTDDGGIKTKILEAMAMSKPVVVTSIGARGIDVTPGRDIVVADEPKEFADRVVELLNDKPLRRKIGLNARKFMEEEHSCETATDRLIKVFEEVVGGCGNK
jgi:glycosyltransferase involved in cell wall biosynthesis